ncbi:hypothetical protein [Atopobium fossor]|uniref:hypothetical protein n=1 Tax=Atopobium fossor TaxID=39487 RepID=UPI00040219FC|nr:hypothetical protein [Atopobium fossor]
MASVFISQPMRGLSKDQIKAERQRIKATLDHDDMVINCSIAYDGEHQLWHLGRALQDLDIADKAIFSKDWQTARSCIIEHMACEMYGVPIVEV